MKPTTVMMMARKVWPLQTVPPVAHSRRREIMLAFRPSPEIPGFNLHYLAAARKWMKKEKKTGTTHEDIGHIRKGAVSNEEMEEATKRLKNLPEPLIKEMEALWKNTGMDDKPESLWAREEIRRSRFGGSIVINEYWKTAMGLARDFLVPGPTNLMQIMHEGGYLEPNKDHDCLEFQAYLERRLGKKVYVTFKNSAMLKCNTVDGVYLLFDMGEDTLVDHPNQVHPGKFRVGGAATGSGGGGAAFG